MNSSDKNGPLVSIEQDTLRDLPLPELRALFQEVFDRSPPPRAGADFLLGNLAWAVQALKLRKNPDHLREKLMKAARSTRSPHKAHCRPGTQLIREWQGQTYEVTILERGYLWQGRTYRSLTEIATRITGTRWSGPRFFGLRGPSG